MNQNDSETEIDVCRSTDDKTYNFVVLTYAFSIAISAILIDDLSLVFGMFAAFSESLLDFVLPGFIFVAAVNYSGKSRPCAKFVAATFGLAGFGYFCLSNYWNLIKIGVISKIDFTKYFP